MPRYDYFVAHKFTEQEKDDLRVAIENAFKGNKLNPSYADNEVRESGTHILDKIIKKINETKFGIFDITDGNPNVCLELGIAKGLGRPFYIICHKNSINNIPSDLKGLDRIEYGSYKELTRNIKEKILPELEMPKTILIPNESSAGHENRLRDHSMLLLDKNLRFRTKTSIGFENFFNSELRIQIQNLHPITPESDMYSKEVDAHLESGYERVRKIMRKRESLISEHNAKAKQFLINVKSKIIMELKQKNYLNEWDDVGQPPIKYFTKYLLFEAGAIIQLFYERITDIDTILKVEKSIDRWQTSRWQICYNRVLVATDDEKEIREMYQMIKGTLVNAINSEDFKILTNYFEKIKAQHALFIPEINDIIKEVENGGLLEGHCGISICRNS